MAVTFDAVSSGAHAVTADSLTVSHTVGNNPDRILYTFISCRAGADVSGVTFNSVAMTQVGADVEQGGLRLTVWRLVAPAVTTADIVASFTTSTAAALVGVSVYNVDQVTPESDTATAGGGSTTPAITGIDITSGELALSATGFDNVEVATLTADSGWTDCALVESTTGSNGRGVSVCRLATAGSQGRTDTTSASVSWGIFAVVLNEADITRAVSDGVKGGENIDTALAVDSGPDGALFGDSTAYGGLARAQADGAKFGDFVSTFAAITPKSVSDGLSFGDESSRQLGGTGNEVSAMDGLSLGETFAILVDWVLSPSDGLRMRDFGRFPRGNLGKARSIRHRLMWINRGP